MSAKFEWLGYPAHFIGARECTFRMATKVGNYIVSSVGDYQPNEGKRQTIGAGPNAFFETYVFKAGPVCDCGCGEPRIADGLEIDGIRAATATEARNNHMKYCRKYARRA